MSGPAPIWRETKMRLWQEKPEVKFIQGQPVVEWGRRHIPLDQLTDEAKAELGIFTTNADVPVARQLETSNSSG